MVVMNYSTLITATDLQFGKTRNVKGKNQQMAIDLHDKSRDQDLKVLKTICGPLTQGLTQTEIDGRLVLIGMLVDLMVFDLTMEKGGTSQ